MPAGNISDIPGPVTLLGLVPTDEEGGRRTMEPLYVITRFDGNTPTTVFFAVSLTPIGGQRRLRDSVRKIGRRHPHESLVLDRRTI